MQALLSLLFAIGMLIEPSPPPLSPEPLTNHPPLTALGLLNATFDHTHSEGWDKVMAIPDPVYQEQSTSTHRGMGSGGQDVEQWRPLVAGQFPPEQLENALCVINSESGGNPSAKNPNSNARGLFQVMTSVWGDHFGFSYEDFYIPELNVYAAARIWESSGWQPWSPRTRRNCGL